MFRKKTIRVEFYNADSGEKIGYDDQKIKQLPEDFEGMTQVEIDGMRYTVVSAEPDERKKIKRAGTLIIRMVPYVKPAEQAASMMASNGEAEASESQKQLRTYISSSKPDIFPAFTGQRGSLHLLEMGAWEWRSVEFVGAAHELDVKTEFASIRDLRKYHGRIDSGREVYDLQHRRSLISRPLDGLDVDLETLMEMHFPHAKAVAGITFMGAEGIADGGFAYHLAGGTGIYGLAFGHRVGNMGLATRVTTSALDLALVADFMSAHNLLLVDWRELQIVGADVADLQAWNDALKFQGQGDGGNESSEDAGDSLADEGEAAVVEEDGGSVAAGLEGTVLAVSASEELVETLEEEPSNEVLLEGDVSEMEVSEEVVEEIPLVELAAAGSEVVEEEAAEASDDSSDPLAEAAAPAAEVGEGDVLDSEEPSIELKLVDLDSLSEEE